MTSSSRARGTRGSLALVAAGVLVLAGCSSDDSSEPDTPPEPVNAAVLSESITEDALVAHLQELEDIAGEHDGNRAAGTSGYDASVDYVADVLRDHGFDVETPEFDFHSFDVSAETLSSAGSDLEVRALAYSPSTGAEGITARVVPAPVDETPGCEATDYDGLDVAGAVVLVDRGVCPFTAKQEIAAERGAAAVLVANNEEGALTGGTLGEPEAGKVPTGGISQADGAALRAAPGEVTLVLDTVTESSTSRNVLAQTRTGSTDDVVVVGAHLDSVVEGPGINDNGTGVAAVLETAVQLGAEPNVTNAVRFAFWGAEELGLIGSETYVAGLSPEELEDIALYLNFDMLGSENAGYLAYDGDDSDQVGAGPGPEGSAGIERTFVEFLGNSGIAADGTDFDGRSDYGPFVAQQIPSGGVFSGADDVKTPAQAEKWGGEAEVNFDRNYHTPDDTLANVDRTALAQHAAAVGFAVGTYASTLDGPNGVPTGEARTQARAGE
ncbi:M20/M25/M40 family metallo-hydrolase [Rhodococcus triatomae]|uniref:Zn-dependent amino-or carboxypeptidase, M28 family n=1 Tax=Rhodococcus triatomae TaxID=300028 RepID=A0A1G8NDN6_9NOCA|nr:M20/M25/M40 family metallo-hydrolase [Rhodococcus triatomae]QNG19978.1 M20/M25/M40 family metallo-hydrolase [Rhodococcus triatomae]QNG24107.1 M20/M25/M40 family metallo-hydrolase [Rhodococcus triatomae]SDI78379.1 Zn-dependent amino-or carboxypeptidase, M28 family [Rhodococcus triatomae]